MPSRERSPRLGILAELSLVAAAMGKAGQARNGVKTFGKTKRSGLAKATGQKPQQAPAKLKKGLEPGTVLILLAGRFRGKRVVFLKQLESGLLLVTGPYAVNGVPLRRVNQRFCIATSAKVGVEAAAGLDAVGDAYFAREAKKKGKKDESSFFAAEAGKAGLSDEKKAGQKKLDEGIVKGLSGDMKAYLKARFSLSAKMYPHELKF